MYSSLNTALHCRLNTKLQCCSLVHCGLGRSQPFVTVLVWHCSIITIVFPQMKYTYATHTHKSSSDWLRWSKCVICSVWFAVVVNESPLSQEKIIMKDAAYWTAIFTIYCIYCDNQIWLFCTICLCVYWYIKLHDFHIELFLQDAIAGYFTITFVLWMAKFGLFCHMIYDQPLLHICITKM